MNKYFLFLLIILQGCATKVVQLTDSVQIGPDRRGEAYEAYQNPDPSGSKVIVVRDKGFLGSIGLAALYFDGALIGYMLPRESVVLHVTPGEHLIGIRPSAAKGSTDYELLEQSVLVSEGKDYYFRITVDPYKGQVLHRTSQIK